MSELNNIALEILKNGKGILAADESTGTMTKRLENVNVQSTVQNRLLFRETLFSSSSMTDCIGGVILYDETIKQIIEKSETVLWNGPAGYFENPNFANGSFEIAKKIIERNKDNLIYSIAGGGDTIAVLNQIGAIDTFNFISTAGGAFLEYLEGKELPGIKALN